MATYQAAVDALISLAKRSAGPSGGPNSDVARVLQQIPEAVLRVCQYGKEARLAAIERILEIEDTFTEMNVLSQIVRGATSDDSFSSDALWQLANSIGHNLRNLTLKNSVAGNHNDIFCLLLSLDAST